MPHRAVLSVLKSQATHPLLVTVPPHGEASLQQG